MRAEVITGPIACHGEGPVWCEGWGGLRWVDMFEGDVLALCRDGTVERRHTGPYVSALRPRRDGGAVIAGAGRFLLEAADGSLRRLDPLWSGQDVLLNDGACDPDGRFYCGSLARDRRPDGGRLYRMEPDGSVQVVLEPVTLSNGLDWSPDGTKAYYIDSATYRIDVFDYTSECGLSYRRPFAEVAVEGEERIRPDGLAVDSEGGVWVALCYGGTVRRYTPEGTLDAVIEIGARKVTACTFGGPQLDELLITTSRYNVEPGTDPLAGSVFRVEAGIKGQAVREFAG